MKKAYLMTAALVAACIPSMFAGTGATADSPLTVAEAIAVAEETGETATTDSYYIEGYVVSGSIDTSYGNATFKLGDEAGVDAGFTAFRIKSFNNEKFTDANLIKMGDKIEVYAPIVNYKGNTPETNYGYLIAINGETSVEPQPDPDPVDPSGAGTESNPFTCADVISGAATGTAFVGGYIVGSVGGQSLEKDTHFDAAEDTASETNILISDNPGADAVAECVPVQLPKGSVRDGLNLKAHPDNLGKYVVLEGSIEAYFKVPGLKSTKSYKFADGPTSVSIVTDDNAPIEYFNLQGMRVANPENGIFVRRQGNNVSKVMIRK